MARQPLHNSPHFQIPDDHLGVLARTGDESIALADIDVGDEVEVAVEAGLQGERVTIPHLEDAARKRKSRFSVKHQNKVELK